MTELPAASSKELALYAAKLASDKKGSDLQLLEVGRISIVADYFLLATGNTAVQVKSICDHLLEGMKKHGHHVLQTEGMREAWWVVLDFGVLVVHVFQPEARSFYDLERLWREAPLLVPENC